MPLFVVRREKDLPQTDARVVFAEHRRGAAGLTDAVRRLFSGGSRMTVKAVAGKRWQHEICLDDPGVLRHVATPQETRAAYRRVLGKAVENGYESVVVPLLACEPDCLIGEAHLNLATEAVRAFLEKHDDMWVWLLLPAGATLQLDEERSEDVRRFLDENLHSGCGLDFGNSYSLSVDPDADGEGYVSPPMFVQDVSASMSLPSDDEMDPEFYAELLQSVDRVIGDTTKYAGGDGIRTKDAPHSDKCFHVREDELQKQIRECDMRIMEWDDHLNRLRRTPAACDRPDIIHAIEQERYAEKTLRDRLITISQCCEGTERPQHAQLEESLRAELSCVADDEPDHSNEPDLLGSESMQHALQERAEHLGELHRQLLAEMELLSEKQRQKRELLEALGAGRDLQEQLDEYPVMLEKREERTLQRPFPAMKRHEKSHSAMSDELAELLKQLDESFSEMLLRLIRERKMSNEECYNRANVTKQLFSKIKKDETYMPKKQTVAAFCIALKLDWEKSKELLAKAGHAMSGSSKFDVIIHYCISNEVFELDKVNLLLNEYEQPLLGSVSREDAA